MAYRDLDEFLVRLEQSGDAKIHSLDSLERGPLDATFGGDAKVHIYRTAENEARVVRNLFGTRARIEQALRVVNVKLIADRLEAMLDLGKPGAFGALIGQAMQLFSALRATSNRRAAQSFQSFPYAEWTRPVQELSFAATLMTGGQASLMRPVVVRLTGNGAVIDSAPDLGVGEQLALVIGGDPAFLVATLTPLPDLLHRSFFASWLRERPIEVMRLGTLDVDLPANADAVLAGKIAESTEGTPNVFLDPDARRLTVDIDQVYTRNAPILLHWSPQERDVVAGVLLEMFLPVLRRMLPGLRDEQIRPFIASVAGEYMAARREQSSGAEHKE